MQKLITFIASAIAVASAAEYPGDDCCTLYAEDDFGGAFETFYFDEAWGTIDGNQNFLMSQYDFEDEMRSWWCGKNLSYDFCKNIGGNCDFENGLSAEGKHTKSARMA